MTNLILRSVCNFGLGVDRSHYVCLISDEPLVKLPCYPPCRLMGSATQVNFKEPILRAKIREVALCGVRKRVKIPSQDDGPRPLANFPGYFFLPPV